ncbi:uroporphyrinogen-III C-methyltransferase [Telluribacter sp.]|uniref:uroporphyrinogen-III C-methyltransferase n=1 Tax=Telluribacter sp. TaxID=1978767 RepID=UPI002E1301A2|nr:uroporphyrinogen-III C-methyltransferase [Telluribacter sp.]
MLTLVGAGPGDEELITLKGIRALGQADVVLYDELANAALLEYAPAPALKIYVGKSAGNASFSQEEINALIVRLATRKGHVVRLKGGDPFVFGRGHEELEYAKRYGIECKVVPGISSCIAVPSSQGIAVTRRGVSESFWVITGTTRSGEMSEDLQLAAQSKATVVVLMGMSKLAEICAMYTRFGRGHMPMAVIQNGTRPDERWVVGQAWEMPRLVAEQGVGAPAIIVIGEVVALHPSYVSEYLQSLSVAVH